MRGVTGDVDLDLLREVGHAGHHMMTDNTLERFREVWYPDIYTRRRENPNGSDIMERIADRIDAIVQGNPGSKLTEAQLEMLNRKQQEFLARVI